jgi:hypothetical protein
MVFAWVYDILLCERGSLFSLEKGGVLPQRCTCVMEIPAFLRPFRVDPPSDNRGGGFFDQFTIISC